jgi:hypothetical protein
LPKVVLRPEAAWLMRPFSRAALGGRHLPLVGGGLHQHHARCGTALADVLLRLADAAAAAGGEVAPDALACQVLARRRVLGRDPGPVALQLFGHQLGQAGQRALAHLRARDADDHAVVRLHHHPGVHLGRGAWARSVALGTENPTTSEPAAAALPRNSRRETIVLMLRSG